MIPSPKSLGFPAKFEKWRVNQSEAISDFLGSSKRFVGQMLAVGGGKTAVGIAQAVISKSRTMVLTSTKGLQTQILDDFEPMGLKTVMGKGSYQCAGVSERTCEEGG